MSFAIDERPSPWSRRALRSRRPLGCPIHAKGHFSHAAWTLLHERRPVNKGLNTSLRKGDPRAQNHSPTSELGKKTKSTPYGSVNNPINPISFALGAEATFVARTIDVNVKHMGEMLMRAFHHQGAAFVEIYQNCNVFNDGAWDYATEKDRKSDTTVYLEHGKPLIFGKNREKGIRLNGLNPEIVSLGGDIQEDDLMFHDEKSPNAGLPFLLSHLRQPEFPETFGVFRAVEAPRFDEEIYRQIKTAQAKGRGRLEALLNEGETWTVN